MQFLALYKTRRKDLLYPRAQASSADVSPKPYKPRGHSGPLQAPTLRSRPLALRELSASFFCPKFHGANSCKWAVV